MKKILLDTNAYPRLFAGDRDVLNILAESETVYLSVFVLGELYAGFAGGLKEKENKAALKQFLEKPTVKILHTTNDTAEIFGNIKNQLKTAGAPIPINDVWIAAHSKETGTMLVTFDPDAILKKFRD